ASGTVEEQQVDAHAHAAHPDDLPCGVDEREVIQQVPPVVLEGLGEALVHLTHDLEPARVVEVGDPRWLLDDPPPAVHRLRQLLERTRARATLALLLDVLRDAATPVLAEISEQLVDVDAVVPD